MAQYRFEIDATYMFTVTADDVDAARTKAGAIQLHLSNGFDVKTGHAETAEERVYPIDNAPLELVDFTEENTPPL